MRYVKCIGSRRSGRRRNNGFTLFEMVVVICAIVILYMVAEQRLNDLPAAAERASFFAILDQLRTGVNFEVYTRLARGGKASVMELAGTNPMDMLLEAPSNYRGELDTVTDTNIDKRRSWYFETSTGELVYVVGGPSIDDVWVSFGNIEVNYGQIRMKLENVYDGEPIAGNVDAGQGSKPGDAGKWQGLLLNPAMPFRWEQRPEEPVEI